jgi:hypothetical protein
MNDQKAMRLGALRTLFTNPLAKFGGKVNQGSIKLDGTPAYNTLVKECRTSHWSLEKGQSLVAEMDGLEGELAAEMGEPAPEEEAEEAE